MKDYKKHITLRCETCGDTEFDENEEDKSLTCCRCGKCYPGGYDELVQANTAIIEEEIEKSRTEIADDLDKEIKNMFKKSI